MANYKNYLILLVALFPLTGMSSEQCSCDLSEVDVNSHPSLPRLQNIVLMRGVHEDSIVDENDGIKVPEINKLVQQCEEAVKEKELPNSTAVGKLIANALTSCYVSNSFLTSFVDVPGNSTPTETLSLNVREGVLMSQDITIKNKISDKTCGDLRLDPAYVAQRIYSGYLDPLKTIELEEKLKVLQMDSRIEHIEASLHPVDDVGATKEGGCTARWQNSLKEPKDNSLTETLCSIRNCNRLTVNVLESPVVDTLLSSDYAMKSEEVNDSIHGISTFFPIVNSNGDGLRLSYQRNRSDSLRLLRLGYNRPTNFQGSELRFESAIYETQVTEPEFRALDINGERRAFSLKYHHKHVQELWEGRTTVVGFSHQRGQSFVFGNQGFPLVPGYSEDGKSSTTVLSIGRERLTRFRDREGLFAFSVFANLGVDMFGATRNSGQQPDGQFFSLHFALQNTLNYAAGRQISYTIDGQLSADRLLPSEQFSVGGLQSMRGFSSGARTGDSGFKFSIYGDISDPREILAGKIVFGAYANIGGAWRNVSGQNDSHGKYIAGVGLSANYENHKFPVNLQFDIAAPLAKETENTRQRPVIYASLTWNPFKRKRNELL